ncbi:MAG: S8 family peptidase [Bacteroidota bacterium]|nr:S8 family peptidase [Bacteroidota bacterium]
MKTRLLFSSLMTLVLFGLLVIFFSRCSREKGDFTISSADKATAVAKVTITQVEPQYVPDELLVKFKEGASETARGKVLSKIKGFAKEKIQTHAMKHSGDNEGITLVSTQLDAREAVRQIKGSAEIEYAEPNWIYTSTTIANDPYFVNGLLWGMMGTSTSPANQFGCQAAADWPTNTGSNTVYVGIIDEGYMYTHEDLAANAGTNPYEIAGNRKDDDRNGYIDDVYGWDFVKNDNTVFDGLNDDHGTHVAGILGAVGNNGKGVVGVCWKIKLLDAKFLGPAGGTTANAIKAIDYFTKLKLEGVNIVATNNSWGGGGYSSALAAAIERANAAGILFIAAAGNSAVNIDNTPFYPAAYTNANIISVASINSSGGLSYFSNYGAQHVALGAPGEGIWSCVPVYSKGKIVSGYANYSGTSMATPHVTGAVALYAASHPGATAATIKAAILANTIPTSSLTGKCVSGGRLSVIGF